MIWWFIAIVFILIGAAILLKRNIFSSYEIWPVGVIIFSFSIAFGILLTQWVCMAEYKNFLIEFEIMREQYNTITGSNPNLFNIADVMEMNKELAIWQTSYIRYGEWWHIVPETVMDILPIGG